MEWQWNQYLALCGWGKIAVGEMRQQADIISGNTGATATNGGLLFNPADTGTHRADRIVVIPELNLSLVYSVTPNIRLMGGYNVMYISSVARAGSVSQQVPTTTTIRFGDTPPITNTTVTPGFRMEGQGSTLQGINLGVEIGF